MRLLTMLYLSTLKRPFPSSPLPNPRRSSSPRSSNRLTRSSISMPPRLPFPAFNTFRPPSSHCRSVSSRLCMWTILALANFNKYIPINNLKNNMAINPSINTTNHNPFVTSQTSQPTPFPNDTIRLSVASRRFKGDVGDGEDKIAAEAEALPEATVEKWLCRNISII